MKYTRCIFFLLLFNLLSLVTLWGQPHAVTNQRKKIFFGPQLGGHGIGFVGTNVIDSVAIFSETLGWRGPYVSVYAEKPLTNTFSLRTEFTFLRVSTSFLVMDLRPDPYWGVSFRQPRTAASNNIQIPVLLNVRLPGPLNYFSVLGGLDSHIQFRATKNTQIIPVGARDFTPQSIPLHNNLYKTTRTYVPFRVLGLRMDVWRFTLIARYEANLGRSYSRNLPVWGQSIPLKTQKAYLHVTLAYKFYSLKWKSKANGISEIR